MNTPSFVTLEGIGPNKQTSFTIEVGKIIAVAYNPVMSTLQLVIAGLAQPVDFPDVDEQAHKELTDTLNTYRIKVKPASKLSV